MKYAVIAVALLATWPTVWAANPAVNGSATALSETSSAYTVPASTTALMVVVCDQDSAGSPTSVTYNGVSLSKIANYDNGGFSSEYNNSVWVLFSPPTGTSYSIVATPAGSVGYFLEIAVPWVGLASNAQFGAASTESDANTYSNQPITFDVTTGASAGGLTFASLCGAIIDETANGANQTNLLIQTSGSASLSTDTIPGADTPNFSWMGANGYGRVNVGFAINPAVVVPLPVLSGGKPLLSGAYSLVSQ